VAAVWVNAVESLNIAIGHAIEDVLPLGGKIGPEMIMPTACTSGQKQTVLAIAVGQVQATVVAIVSLVTIPE